MKQISRRWQLVVIWEADGKGTLKIDKEEIRDEEKRLHVSVTPVEIWGGGGDQKAESF